MEVVIQRCEVLFGRSGFRRAVVAALREGLQLFDVHVGQRLHFLIVVDGGIVFLIEFCQNLVLKMRLAQRFPVLLEGGVAVVTEVELHPVAIPDGVEVGAAVNENLTVARIANLIHAHAEFHLLVSFFEFFIQLKLVLVQTM